MATSDISFEALSYQEVKEIYLRNIRMGTIDECDSVLASIAAMDLIPIEIEEQGQRVTRHELNSMRERALKARGVLSFCGRRTPTYIPTGELR